MLSGEVVESGARARAVPRDEPRVVVVREPAAPPIVAPVPEPRPSRAPEVMAGLAALLAAIGILIWALNPHFFEPKEPLSGPSAPGQHHVHRVAR